VVGCKRHPELVIASVFVLLAAFPLFAASPLGAERIMVP